MAEEHAQGLKPIERVKAVLSLRPEIYLAMACIGLFLIYAPASVANDYGSFFCDAGRGGLNAIRGRSMG
jgi:hypothetical protein